MVYAEISLSGTRCGTPWVKQGSQAGIRSAPASVTFYDFCKTGMLTPQVASSLGISISTLNKHLASTRRKLGVKRTAHALLLDAEGRRISTQQQRDVDVSSYPLRDFESALEVCHTFDEAWDILRDHADRLGVITNACGVSAEPPGMVTNGARAIKRDVAGRNKRDV